MAMVIVPLALYSLFYPASVRAPRRTDPFVPHRSFPGFRGHRNRLESFLGFRTELDFRFIARAMVKDGREPRPPPGNRGLKEFEEFGDPQGPPVLLQCDLLLG
jgi:hypothetical protein